MTYYELQELIWVQVCSQKGNHHWHLLRHNIRITIFVIVESIQQVFINSPKPNYSIWDCVHTWGAVSITNWSRFSIFFTSSWWVDISVSAVWTNLNQTQKSGFTSSSHLTDLTIPASIISHPATLSRTLWKVPRIFERRPRCDQEKGSLGKYFVFVTEDTQRIAAAQ